MNTERADPFKDIAAAPVFEPKPKKAKPVDADAIEQIASDQKFTSRQPAKSVSPAQHKRRVYTTGRNRQLNFKATSETAERFYRMADERKMKLCELLEQALDALEQKAA